MAPPKDESFAAVLNEIRSLREEFREFVRRHDDREREEIREGQRVRDSIGALEKWQTSIDNGKDGKVDVLFQKVRAINNKILLVTGGAAVFMFILQIIGSKLVQHFFP